MPSQRKRLAVPPGGFRRISVLRLSSLGDVVLTLPVVHALRRAYPEARLRYWVKQEFADPVRFDPAIEHVRVLEPEARRLEDLVSMGAELADEDLIVDLHGSLRSRVLTFRQPGAVLRQPPYRWRREALVRARWLRVPLPPPAVERYADTLAPLGLEAGTVPRVTCSEDAERWAAEYRLRWRSAPIAVCPGAKHFTKRWPEGHWTALHRALRAQGLPLLYFSLPSERAALAQLARLQAEDPETDWCTESLDRMAAALSFCGAAVTSDSGLMHLAAGRGVRVVAMFGGTDPRLGFAPSGEGHQVLCRREPCQPCHLHGRPACPRGHFRCMRLLEPAQVQAALGRVLELHGARQSS